MTTAAELAALERDWWALYRRSPAATPFSTPAWLLPWWHVFAPGELRSIAVTDETGRLVGLAPLYLEDGSSNRRLLPLGIGISDHTDVLIDPAQADAVAATLIATLATFAPDWRQWSAEEALPNAAVLALTPPGDWSVRVCAASACPVVSLPSAPSELAGTVPSTMRRKWSMARNRTARRGGIVRPTTVETLADDLATLVRLHGLRWAERGEAGVLVDERVRRFHAAAAPQLLAEGLLRMATLRFGDEAAGVIYGLRGSGESYAYLNGFDPAYAFESPGTVLVGHLLEQAVEDRARRFSFLRGQEPYKYRWGAVDRWNMTRIFEPRL